MTSQRKIEANRRNAKRSTGPRTALGKARSRANALKHGLASAVLRPVDKAEDKEFYEALLGRGQTRPEQREHALTVMETTRELEYVRAVRARLVKSMDDKCFICVEPLEATMSIERYERRALSRRRKAARNLPSD